MTTSLSLLQLPAAARDSRARPAFDLSRDDLLSQQPRHAGFQHGIALAITFQCNIECEHCVTKSSPSVKEHIPLDDILQIIDELAKIPKVSRLGLTGGEPFLRFHDMKTIVPYASSRGLEVSIITNSYWATSFEKARRHLEQLEGLTRLGVSEDVFHRRFIPRINLEYAIRAANSLEIEVGVRFSFLKDRADAIEQLIDDLHGAATRDQIDAQPVVLTGRAIEKVDRNDLFQFDPRGVTCSAVNRPVVTPGGNVYACCGPALAIEGPNNPLILGNVLNGDRLEDIIDASETNYLLHAIRALGPFWLARLTEDDRFLEYDYVDHCDICRVVLSDSKAVSLLKQRLAEPGVQRMIAMARALQLQEMDMFMRCP